MKGILSKPHYLQAIILAFSLFFMLSSVALFWYQAVINCHYDATGYEEISTTNDEYGIKCVGNSITTSFYGLTALMIMGGFAISHFSRHDADYLISFVIFGILVAYTSDVCTNLRVNCVAGDTTEMNTFDDDSYDSASEKCTLYTYGMLSGLMGCIGGFTAGYYAVLMKVTGKFYMQRPAGLFVALSGYALIFCFNNLATAEPLCHYYESGSDLLPVPPPLPTITDDIVNNQLHPLCTGYTQTGIGYGVGGGLSLFGLIVMYVYQKRGMWVIFAMMCAIFSLSNSFMFTGAKESFCDAADNKISNIPGAYTDYQQQKYDDSCSSYGHSVIVSRVATSVAGLSALISILDVIFHFDHDTFRIRLRRALLFAFGCCFSVANMFAVFSTAQSDCALYHDELSDDFVDATIETRVQRLQCQGQTAQIICYFVCMAMCGVGVIASLICNFPETFDAECLADFEVMHDDDWVDEGHGEDAKAKLLGGDSPAHCYDA